MPELFSAARPAYRWFTKASGRSADKGFMERRETPRLFAELSGCVTRLGRPKNGAREQPISIVIQDVSEGGIRFVAPEALECGAFLVINIEESTLFGQVRYCLADNSNYIIGVLVEKMLMGGSSLSILIEGLLTADY